MNIPYNMVLLLCYEEVTFMLGFLNPNKKTLKRLEKIADQVLALAPTFQAY